MSEFGLYAGSGYGGYSSSYSNLSALAPPFTVDRSNSKPPAAPIVGFVEPCFNSLLNSPSDNWVDPSANDCFSHFDSMFPSNVYPFHANDYSYSRQTVHIPTLDSISTASTAAFSYDPNMDATRNDFPKATLYYPANVSPATCISAPHIATYEGPSNVQTSSSYHTSQRDGFWGVSSFDEVLRGSYSKEMSVPASSIFDDHMSSGVHMTKGPQIPDESSISIHMPAEETRVTAAGAWNEDPKYFLEQRPSDISVGQTSIPGLSSVPSGANLQAAKAVNSMENQATFSSTNENGLKQKQHAGTLSNNLSGVSNSPVLLSKPPVAGTSYSTSDTVSIGAVNSDVSATDTGFYANSQSDVKEPSEMPSHGRKVCFNPSLVSIQLQKNDALSSEFSSIGNGEFSNNRISCNDAFDHWFAGKSGIRASHFNQGDFNAALDVEESIRVEKSFDILDHYTPSIDSPCWKGSSGSLLSPFGTTEVVVRHIKGLETFGPPNIQGPYFAPINTPNALKVSSEDTGKVLGSSENEILGNGSVPSLNRPAGSNVHLGDALSDDVRETMSWTIEGTCSNDCPNNVNEPREGRVLSDKLVDKSNKSLDKSNPRVFQTVQQNFQEGRMAASDGLHQLKTSVADASDNAASHMSLLPTGNFIYTPFSVGSSENEILANVSVPALNSPAGSNVQLGDTLSDHARETMSWTMKGTCSNDCPNNVTEPREGCVLSDKSVDKSNKSAGRSDARLCQTMQQSLQEGRMVASDRLHQPKTSVADASDNATSNVSFLPARNFIYMPFSPGAPTTHSQSYDKYPSPKNHIQALVNTMYNLSEFLLFYCSEEGCELKEQDLKTLKNVNDNIDKCVSENLGPALLLAKNHEGLSVERQQTAAPDILSQPELSEVQEKLNCSANKDKEYCSSPCVEADAGIKPKDEKIIQAIKKVLKDHFHEKKEEHLKISMYKNLWLEAEAALCASNCTARYNRMKIEMEKCKSESSRDSLEEAVGGKQPSNVKADARLKPRTKDGPTSACISIQSSPIVRTCWDSDDVTDRFSILKSHGDNTESRKVRDVDELPSSKVSPDFDDILTPSTTEFEDFFQSSPDPLIQDSPIFNATCQVDDVEASVVARFHILKSRAEGSSFTANEGKPLPQVVDVQFVGEKRQDSFGKDNVENDGEMVPVFQPIEANHAGKKLGLKDFNVNSDPVSQQHGASRLGNQLSPGWYDNSSSDWEHVLNDELCG